MAHLPRAPFPSLVLLVYPQQVGWEQGILHQVLQAPEYLPNSCSMAFIPSATWESWPTRTAHFQAYEVPKGAHCRLPLC